MASLRRGPQGPPGPTGPQGAPGAGAPPAGTGALGSVKLSHAAGDPTHPVAVEDADPRNTNARAPTAHGASHAVGGSDVLAPSDIAAEAVANKGVAGGYAGLDGSALVPTVQIPATVAKYASAGTFTAGQTITPATPGAVGLALNAKSTQDYTETVTNIARPVSAHQGFIAAPGQVPGQSTDYHGVDRVLSCSSALTMPGVGLYPTETDAQFSGSGSLGPVVGLYSRADNTGAGTVANLRCLRVRATNTGGGTAGTVEGIKVNIPDNTGSTITNAYGVYIDDMTAVVGTLTNTPYAIYAEGGQSFHGGALGIGPGATTPAAMLHIRPHLASDVALMVQEPASPTGDVFRLVDNTNTTRILTIDKSGQIGFGTSAPGAPVHLKGTGASADTFFIEASGSGAKNVVMRADGTVGLGLNYPTQALNAVRLQVEFNAAGIQRNLALTNNHATTAGDGTQIEFDMGGNQWGFIQCVEESGGGSTLRFQARTVGFTMTEYFRLGLNGIGFFGATPVAKPTLAVAATDLATVITLANDLRTRLINYGLGA